MRKALCVVWGLVAFFALGHATSDDTGFHIEGAPAITGDINLNLVEVGSENEVSISFLTKCSSGLQDYLCLDQVAMVLRPEVMEGQSVIMELPGLGVYAFCFSDGRWHEVWR